MARRNGSVHVATTTRTYKGKTYKTHLLRRTYREGGRVKHQTLGNISHLPEETIELIARSLQGEECVVASESLSITRSLPHGHVKAALTALRRLELDRLIASTRGRKRDLVIALVLQRILSPTSKLATARGLADETAGSTLGQELELGDLKSEQELYEAMDWLVERQGRIEKKLAQRHLRDGSLILYDVSSSYYTGRCCPLAQFGNDRDGKGGYPIIAYGLLCNKEGCPIAVEVFEGNTADPKTLSAQIKKVRRRFGIKRVIFVGDRGMLTSARIEEECRPVEGLDWISSLRGPQVAKLLQEGSIHPGLFDERHLAEITSNDYPGERLVVCRNPHLAQERARKRQELLAATEKLLEEVRAATLRSRRPLRGKENIGLRVGKVINRYKVGKHFEIEIGESSFTYRRKEEKINQEAALDGLYAVRTSVGADALDDASVVRAYKDLSQVEQAFRSLKTVDLKVRPIHHWLEHRVRAHVFLCMLAYYVEWHMRQAWAPILFEDEDPEGAETKRESIVTPAQRSDRARDKEQRKQTQEGMPVHSFATLLEDLATLVRNRLRPKGKRAGHEFSLETEPTPLQQKALDLLESITPCSQNQQN